MNVNLEVGSDHIDTTKGLASFLHGLGHTESSRDGVIWALFGQAHPLYVYFYINLKLKSN